MTPKGEGLLTAEFIDPHVYLDKAYVASELSTNELGTLREAIESIHSRKANYSVENIRERIIRAIKAHVCNGCIRIQTHVDVDIKVI